MGVVKTADGLYVEDLTYILPVLGLTIILTIWKLFKHEEGEAIDGKE